MMSHVGLRTVLASDDQFLFELFTSTRPDIHCLSLPVEKKRLLARMQFDAQTLHYRSHFANADFCVVTLRGRPVGRLTVHDRPGEIRVIDIALIPEQRNAGIGTKLLVDVIERAHRAGKPVRLHVEKGGRSKALYDRLGFVAVEVKEMHVLLECVPQSGIVLSFE